MDEINLDLLFFYKQNKYNNGLKVLNCELRFVNDLETFSKGILPSYGVPRKAQ